MYLLSKKVRWTLEEISNTKQEVRDELKAVHEASGSEARLRHINLQIRELEQDTTPRGQLKRYIFSVSALVHHERHGGLSDVQVRHAAELANSILLANGVRPGETAQGNLHAEVPMILSQIWRRAGQHWPALWEQQFSQYISSLAETSGEAMHSLATAERAFRVGFSDIALKMFRTASTGDLSDVNIAKAKIGIARCLRLSGQLSLAMEHVGQCVADPNFHSESRMELDWEQTLLDFLKETNIQNLVSKTRKGKPHYVAAYLVEATLWAKCVPSKAAVDAPIKCTTMVSRGGIKPHLIGFTFKAATRLEDCYDFRVPLVQRIRGLADVLGEMDKLVTIDQELLVWAASARFFARAKAYDFAALALKQYTNLSASLSNGLSQDALGVMSDVINREWSLSQDLDEAG